MDEEAPLVAEKSDSKTPAKNHTRDVHILSSAFLLIFLAYSAAQNLETSINTVSSNILILSIFDEVSGFVWIEMDFN